MADSDPKTSAKTGKSQARTERDQRLAEALRANLNRRKAQIRAREPGGAPEKDADGDS